MFLKTFIILKCCSETARFSSVSFFWSLDKHVRFHRHSSQAGHWSQQSKQLCLDEQRQRDTIATNTYISSLSTDRVKEGISIVIVVIKEMSGLLPDLASWALRGQRQQPPNNNNNDTTGDAAAANNSGADGTVPPPLTAEEMRAQRLQRMQQMQEAAAATPPRAASATKKAPPVPVPVPAAPSPPATTATAAAVKEESKKKRKQAEKGTNKEAEAAKKLQRRKELLLRKILSIELTTTSDDSNTKNTDASPSSASNNNSNNVVTLVMDSDSTDITDESITGILADRLAMTPSQLPPRHMNNNNSNKCSLIAYLGDCHYKASEELKTMRQAAAAAAAASSSSLKKSDNTARDAQNAVITSLLQEMQKQVVTYAATILQEPDLFEMGKHSNLQLAQCLLFSDPTWSIMFGVSGSVTSSFYYMVVEEILQQNDSGQGLDAMVHEIVAYYCAQLATCESVLDVASSSSNTADMDNNLTSNTEASPVLLVSALTALCLHKRVAQAVVSAPQFLLPRPGTREAKEVVDPSAGMPTNRLLQQYMAGMMGQPKYKKRSGPALDKSTVLGLCLRIGTPKNNTPNSTFAPSTILRQSLAAVESATAQQRQQLQSHQTACNQLLHNLIKAGADARNAVLQWFTDAMLVNVGATATRPDSSKVSCNSLLLNVSVALLKLCDPFVHDATKHYLIDAGFVTCAAAHQGMFTLTGDDAIRPLGAPDDEAAASGGAASSGDAMDTYNPKNPFITSLFFLTAKSLILGIASLLSQHENLLRHISHQHWMITSRNGDLQSDPHFAMFIARQRSNEVALFEPDMAKDTLRFLNLLAKILVNLPNEQLATMPEDFVSIVCDVVMSIAKLKAKILVGLEFRDTFELVVKLLSPSYAKVSTKIKSCCCAVAVY
jgi:Ubiquitin elongating factor core